MSFCTLVTPATFSWLKHPLLPFRSAHSIISHTSTADKVTSAHSAHSRPVVWLQSTPRQMSRFSAQYLVPSRTAGSCYILEGSKSLQNCYWIKRSLKDWRVLAPEHITGACSSQGLKLRPFFGTMVSKGRRGMKGTLSF